MQHLGVNFGGIWRFEVDFLYLGFLGFLHKKCGMIFNSPVTLGMIHQQQQQHCYCFGLWSVSFLKF